MSLCNSPGLALRKGKVDTISKGSEYKVVQVTSPGLKGSQEHRMDVLSLGLTSWLPGVSPG